MRRVFLAAAVSLVGFAASAAETGGCGRFAWDLGAERDLLAAAPVSAPASVPASPPAAFRLALGPAETAALPKPPPPDAKPRPGLAGAIPLSIAEAGTYRVTLSGEAWVDAVQHDVFLNAEAFSGVGDCPGMRKSVKFRFDPGPVVLQMRGSAADAIAVAVTRDR